MANLNVEQKTVKELFQGSRYDFLIPDYQRPYEWDEPECKTLWEDLFAFSFPENDYTKFKGEEEEYFLGPIVTFKNNNKMEVIDGQQRLTTLMLLLRAFYNKLGYMKDPRTKTVKEDIEKCIWHSAELGDTLFSSLKIDSQVATDDDKEDFLTILKEGKDMGKNTRYAKNFTFFVKSIDAFLSDYPSFFAYFPTRVLNNCVLLPIEADSQDTALRIFSTLNDRGKPLADADIFKAQFYKYYSSLGRKDEFMEIWKDLDKEANEIFDSATGIPLDELFTRYMYYERARNGIRSTTIEGLRKFYEGDGTYPLLRKEETLKNLVQLAKFWKAVSTQDKAYFSDRVLKQLFILNYAPNGIWTYITSVYYLHNRNENDELEEEAFCQFLKRITAFIWTYTIIYPGVYSLRHPIYDEMVNIINGSEVTFSDFKINESDYRSKVSIYEFSNNRPITKSMLTWWAFQDKDQKLLSLETRFETEHIYARSRQVKESGLQNIKNIELLGNKSLLEKYINISASDYRFADKVKYYNGFPLNNGRKKEGTQIAELLALSHNNDFGEDDILRRNAKIINSFVDFIKQMNLVKE